MKTNKIKIFLPKKTDALTQGNKIKNIPGVIGISVVTLSCLRVKYNPKQITAIELSKITEAVETKIS